MIDYRYNSYTPDKIVREMVKDSEKTPYAISKAAELNKNEVKRWMKGTTPSLDKFNRFVDALGYQIKIERKK
jgi:post-segregation antitoxin (ccd killing protein)